MKRKFNPAEFVKDVGNDLVNEFAKARKATTPDLIGDAMEEPIRARLEQILPKGIAVGSGCVIDSFGGTSRQMDVVLYEKEQCSVFCINNSATTTYYPCEGVLAVGEVKSRIGKNDLANGFEKIKSVKSLQRHFESVGTGQHSEQIGRPYGDHGSATAYSFDLHNSNIGDIFSFVVAEESSIQILPYKTGSSISGYYVENLEALGNDVHCPDMLVFLDGNILTPVTIDTENRLSASYAPTRSRQVLTHGILPKHSESPFGELIQAIWHRYQNGLTAHIPLRKYLHYNTQTEPRSNWTAFVHFDPESQDLGNNIRTPTEHLNYQRTLYTKGMIQQ